MLVATLHGLLRRETVLRLVSFGQSIYCKCLSTCLVHKSKDSLGKMFDTPGLGLASGESVFLVTS